MKTDITYDVKAIVARFGGRTDLQLRLKKSGNDVNIRTIDQWIYRNKIPATYIIILAHLAEEDGGKPLFNVSLRSIKISQN
jgi:hypothetical protein